MITTTSTNKTFSHLATSSHMISPSRKCTPQAWKWGQTGWSRFSFQCPHHLYTTTGLENNANFRLWCNSAKNRIYRFVQKKKPFIRSSSKNRGFNASERLWITCTKKVHPMKSRLKCSSCSRWILIVSPLNQAIYCQSLRQLAIKNSTNTSTTLKKK